MAAKELVLSVTLADCEVQYFKGSGAGGQNRNKRDTAVRIIHHPSGARAECQEQRTQGQNKKIAFRRMAESDKFQTWLRKQMGRATLAEIAVSEQMRPRDLLMEVKDENGNWVPTEAPRDWWK
jgi:protein subunit release factor B